MPTARIQRYKMSDLVNMTGVSREAIRFYISSGLLPPPIKTARNMAWYTDAHVDLVNTIRALQHDQFLPLKAIKSVLHGHPAYEFSPRQSAVISGLKDKLNGGADKKSEQAVDRPAVKISKGHRAQLVELGWISGPGELASPDDQAVISAWSELQQSGLSRLPNVGPKDINYVLETVDFMLEKELEFFREHMSDMKQDEALELLQRGYSIINRLFAVLHGRRARMLSAEVSMQSKKKTTKTKKKK